MSETLNKQNMAEWRQREKVEMGENLKKSTICQSISMDCKTTTTTNNFNVKKRDVSRRT